MRLKQIFEDDPNQLPLKLTGFGKRQDDPRLKQFMQAFDNITKENPIGHNRYFDFNGDESAIVKVDLSPVSFRDVPTIRISDISTPEKMRSQGLASKAMQTICHLADQAGVQLELSAVSYEIGPRTPATSDLKRWYSRFGFIFHGADGTRAPR